MTLFWNGIKCTFAIGLILALVFTSSVFAVLLFAKISGKEWVMQMYQDSSIHAEATGGAKPPEAAAIQASAQFEKKTSVQLQAPAIKQHPELPAGCEVTSLAMLLQFDGIRKSKLDLAAEMKKDPTEIQWAEDGSIKYWGDPNAGFVGDITGRTKAFGIYHAALFELLNKYIPTGVDLTGQNFDKLEEQLSNGFPVIAWTTVNFEVPQKWVTWDSPGGKIRTTFLEHAVLMVGYDENYIYANDPWTGQKNVKIDRKKFIASWEAMGKQAISYGKKD